MKTSNIDLHGREISKMKGGYYSYFKKKWRMKSKQNNRMVHFRYGYEKVSQVTSTSLWEIKSVILVANVYNGYRNKKITISIFYNSYQRKE